MRIAILTNEYPPNVYGGAGVHVEYLTRELARARGRAPHVRRALLRRPGRARGEPARRRRRSRRSRLPAQDPRHAKLFDTMLQNLVMADGRRTSTSSTATPGTRTWPAAWSSSCRRAAGADDPLARAAPALEGRAARHRLPRLSWVERTAYQNADGVVAVSESMQHDVQSLYGVPPEKIRVIHNGIDLDQYRPRPDPARAGARTASTRTCPFVLFVGRITRQKGIIHLVNAIRHIAPGVQVVLCAGAPDTQEIAAEMTRGGRARARADSPHTIIWIPEMLPKDEIITLYTHAALFVCPSVYEPFGIINLEAMACETPVVASAVGGIKEVVVHGETGLLVAARGDQRDRLRAAKPRAVLPRPGGRRQRPARRPGPAPAHGRTGARPRRAAVFVDQHRPADARVL